MTKQLLLLLFLVPILSQAQNNIIIDGNFDDWTDVPVAVTDPADDVHDTDGNYPDDGAPSYVAYSDVDILEVKFTNDAENLYGYMKSTGIIGRTSVDSLGQKAGRYYFIFTIDVDNNDTTGYRLKEGGYYPDSKGYDMNMEVEFYNGSYNTGHYINHEYISEEDFDANWLNDLENRVVRLAPGTYDWYSQWVMFPNDSFVVVEDKGPVYYGIIKIAVSEDGHEAEMVAPLWGFLKTPEGVPIIDVNRTIKVSASLEGSGELSEGSSGPTHSNWGSDTAEPFLYEVKDPATAVETETAVNIPEKFTLQANYPNPFNPQTTIKYSIGKTENVRLSVYDVTGREVSVLVNGQKTAGDYSITWTAKSKNGDILPSGIYYAVLRVGNEQRVRSMVLMK